MKAIKAIPQSNVYVELAKIARKHYPTQSIDQGTLTALMFTNKEFRDKIIKTVHEVAGGVA